MKIDMTEVSQQKTLLTTAVTTMNSQLDTAKTSFTNLVNSNSLSGEVKTAIDAKINNYQIPLLTNFSNALKTLTAQYDKTIEQFQSTVSEHASDAIIDTAYLQELMKEYSGLETSISTIHTSTSKIYSDISDIVSLTNPSSSAITTPLTAAKKILTDTKTKMESFDGWKQGDELTELLLAQVNIIATLTPLGKV